MDFKLKVKNWFESFNASFQNPGAAHGNSLPQVSSEIPEWSKMPDASEPKCPNAPTGQKYTTSELSKIPSASEPRSNGQPNTSVKSDGLGDRHASQNSDPPKFFTSSSKKSQRSRSSKSSTSSEKREAAPIKLELARLKKLQNEERIREEEEMERLRHQKIMAEDNRRIREAELEESLYRFQIDTDDDFLTQSDDVTAPSKKKRDFSGPATFVWLPNQILFRKRL